jgi:transposase
VLSRGDLTDDEWAVLKPLLPRSNNRCGRWWDHRQVINGILHRLGTGCRWRQLPARFGPWQTIHKRHMRWSADGTWERLLQHVQAVADSKGDIDWNINIDSTIVRAHQHAAGAPTPPPPAHASKKASPACAYVGTVKQRLTRSTRSLARRADHQDPSECGRQVPTTLAARHPGQRADCTQFEAVMDRTRVPRLDVGRPRRRPDSVSADKAYSNRPVRGYPTPTRHPARDPGKDRHPLRPTATGLKRADLLPVTAPHRRRFPGRKGTRSARRGRSTRPATARRRRGCFCAAAGSRTW